MKPCNFFPLSKKVLEFPGVSIYICHLTEPKKKIEKNQCHRRTVNMELQFKQVVCILLLLLLNKIHENMADFRLKPRSYSLHLSSYGIIDCLSWAFTRWWWEANRSYLHHHPTHGSGLFTESEGVWKLEPCSGREDWRITMNDAPASFARVEFYRCQ